MEQDRMHEPMFMSSDHPHGDLLEKIRPDEIVEVIKKRLMGMEFIDGKWVVNPALKDKALTEKGAFEIATIMLSASSQNVSISKLKDAEIRERTKYIIKTVMEMCLRNWREYGINGSDRFKFIKEIVQTNTYVTLKQPEGAGIQKLLGGTYDVQLRENDSGGEKGGVLSRVLRR